MQHAGCMNAAFCPDCRIACNLCARTLQYSLTSVHIIKPSENGSFVFRISELDIIPQSEYFKNATGSQSVMCNATQHIEHNLMRASVQNGTIIAFEVRRLGIENTGLESINWKLFLIKEGVWKFEPRWACLLSVAWLAKCTARPSPVRFVYETNRPGPQGPNT